MGSGISSKKSGKIHPAIVEAKPFPVTISKDEKRVKHIEAFLRASKEGNNSRLETESLKKLGDSLLLDWQDRDALLLATGVYNAAEARCGREEDAELEEIIQRQKEVAENAFVKSYLKVDPPAKLDYTGTKTQLAEAQAQWKESVERVLVEVPFSGNSVGSSRAGEESEWVERVQKLLVDLGSSTKKVLSLILTQCISVLGKPPCRFACILLSSPADHACPFSPVQPAFVVGEVSQASTKYFEKLIYYMQLKVLNLGQSPLHLVPFTKLQPLAKDALCRCFVDFATPQGLSLQVKKVAASKLGRPLTARRPNAISRRLLQKQTEVVGSAQWVASLDLDHAQVSMAGGDKGLFDEYQQQVVKAQHGSNPGEVVEEWRTHLQTYNSWEIVNSNAVPFSYTALQEVCALPALLEKTLSHHGNRPTLTTRPDEENPISSSSIWSLLNASRKSGVLSQSAAHNLKVAAAISKLFQVKRCSYAGEPNHHDNLYHQRAPLFLRFYSTIYPLYQAIEKRVFSQECQDAGGLLGKGPLLEASSCLTTRAYCRIGLYEEAEKEMLYQEAEKEMLPEEGQKNPSRSQEVLQLSQNALFLLVKAQVEYNLGNADLTTAYLKETLEQCQRAEGGHQENELKRFKAAALSSLGAIKYDLDQVKEATKLFDRALALQRSLQLPPRHAAVSLLSLAALSSQSQNFNLATNYVEKAAELIKSTYGLKGHGEQHLDLVAVLCQEGSIHSQQDRLDAQLKCYTAAIDLVMDLHGNDRYHPNVYRIIKLLATAFSSQGHYGKAVELCATSLQVCRRLLGDSSPDAAEMLSTLGVYWHGMADYGKAIRCHQQCLKVQRQMVKEGPDHEAPMQMALTLNNLGNSYYESNDIDMAMKYYEESLKKSQEAESSGEANNHFKASCLCNLGNVYRKNGDSERAIHSYEDAQTLLRNEEGDVATRGKAEVLNNLANVWLQKEEPETALNFYHQSLEMYASIYGEDKSNLVIAGTLNNIGKVHDSLGEYNKAISYYSKALGMRREVYGANACNLNLATSLTCLGNAWFQVRNYKKAVEYHQEALAIRLQHYGGTEVAHANLAKNMNDLGVCHTLAGDPTKALHYHNCALEMERQLDGEYSLVCASTYYNLGVNYHLQLNYNRAVENYKQSARVYNAICSQEDDQPLAQLGLVLYNLGNVYQEIGQEQKAFRRHEQALKTYTKAYPSQPNHLDIQQTLQKLNGSKLAILRGYNF